MLPVLGDGQNRLHLVYVENVVDVMMLALEKEEAYKGTYIVADNEALSIDDLFTFIADSLGAKRPFRIPEKFLPLLTSLPVIGRKFSFLMKDRYYSIESIKKKLGYTPRTSVYDGLKRAVLSYDR